jgi:uncharacterized protein
MLPDRHGLHLFTVFDKHYVFDLRRLQTYELKSEAFDVLDRFLDDDSPADIDAVSDDAERALLHAMRDAGLINAMTQDPIPRPEKKPYSPIVSSIVLNVAEACNFECSYCFAQQGLYGKENSTLMGPDVGKAAIDWMFARSGAHDSVNLCFFGGEPLLNMPLIRELVAYAHDRAKSEQKAITYTLTTNGSLLDEATISELDKLRVSFQVSVDGVGCEHDANRRFKNSGKGTWSAIDKNLQPLMAAGRPLTARTTVAHDNADIAKVVTDLQAYGFAQLYVSAATGTDGAAVSQQDVTTIKAGLEALGRQYLDAPNTGVAQTGFTNLDREVKRLWDPRFSFSGCAAGKNYFTITVDGDIFACMHIVEPDSPYRLGNVLTGEFDADMHYMYQSIIVDDKRDCANCWARYLCGNACFARNLNMGEGFDKADPDHCAIELKTLEVSLGIIAQLKQAGFEPDWGQQDASPAVAGE